MRNLKKILALVLALVMVIGMMSIASAATPGTAFVDDAEITKYDESIQILEGLGIYQGNNKGEFNYADPITRAEVATLIYRLVHDEKYVSIYKDYNKFDDVASTAWYAGYVNYCANGEFVLGKGNGKFDPMANVTGYEVLAIVLRMLGYDKEGEFQGAGWEVRTARLAKELGITANIVDGTLGAAASRGMVAELIYRAIAQTSTVSYVKLFGYVENETTLAYENFGLRGYADADSYEEIINRDDAAADEIYGEPIAYWYVDDTDGGLVDGNDDADEIEIRFNPVKSYVGLVAENTVYVDSKMGTYVTGSAVAATQYVDGSENASDITATYKNGAYIANTGNGVVSDLFVVEGNIYLVTKNTYVAAITTAYSALTGNVSLNGYAFADYYGLTKGMTAGTKVLFNVYNDTVDYTTFHKATSKVVTIGSTYDNADINTSYFKAGSTKYNYNANYHVIDTVPVVGDAEDIMNGKVDEGLSTALFGLGDKAEVFFDDFGNAILLDAPATGAAAGGVGVVIAGDTLRVSLGKYVMELDMIMSDGSKKTVKAIVGDWTYDEQTADETVRIMMADGAFLTNYIIDATTGYYVLVEGTYLNGLYPVTLADDGAQIVRGDANAADVADAGHAYGLLNLDVDSTTSFIVETYKNDGAEIKGYTTYKGFKNVPTLDELTSMEITFVYDVFTYKFVAFIQGAKVGENPETVTVPELVYVMDDVPEKNLTKDEDGNSVTYWTYTVVKNGQVTTLKSTTDPSLVSVTGLYEIEKSAEVRGFYELTLVTEQQATLDTYNALVGVTYGDVLYCETTGSAAFDKLTLATGVKVYAIAGTTLTEITLADLADGLCVEYLVDKYGYVTTMFVVPEFNGTLDGH